MEYNYNTEDIEWEEVEIFEHDPDGHGTREVAIEGYCYSDQGTMLRFSAIGQQCYPYEDGYENITDIEFGGIVTDDL